jgi:hypothetical protein
MKVGSRVPGIHMSMEKRITKHYRTVCIYELHNGHYPIPGIAYMFFLCTFVSDHSSVPHITLPHSVYLFHIFVISLMEHVVCFSKLSGSAQDDPVLQCVC